jgi:hypothetical protein
MTREVKLNQLDSVLSELSYPVEREAAVDAFEDVTLRLADGEVGLASVVAESSEDAFVSADDLGNEVMSRLPREAVGEPYQSEGEG